MPSNGPATHLQGKMYPRPDDQPRSLSTCRNHTSAGRIFAYRLPTIFSKAVLFGGGSARGLQGEALPALQPLQQRNSAAIFAR